MAAHQKTASAAKLIVTMLFLVPYSRGFGKIGVAKAPPSSSMLRASFSSNSAVGSKGKLLVLGGTGFLGQSVCKRAALEGFAVTSMSRRGLPPANAAAAVDYRTGDAREKEDIAKILNEGDYVGVVHCIGLLFDSESGLGSYNRFVSGSGSLLDSKSTYETITKLSAFNAIEAYTEYAEKTGSKPQELPFVFTSAAEAGWPQMTGGDAIEKFLAPEWLRRYLSAKRAVEGKLLNQQSVLRPVIMRPSLIYSMDRPASYVPVGAFFVGNLVGLPFVDRPVTVQALGNAIVRSIGRDDVRGILRYNDIDKLNE